MKLKLYQIKKNENNFNYVIEKNEILFEIISNILIEFNFERTIINHEFLKELGSIENNYSIKKYSSKLYTDRFFNLENNLLNINIIYGLDKIFISIYSNNKILSRFNNYLFEYLEIIKSN